MEWSSGETGPPESAAATTEARLCCCVCSRASRMRAKAFEDRGEERGGKPVPLQEGFMKCGES
eukprot:1624949-Rhodomonas_salina.1